MQEICRKCDVMPASALTNVNEVKQMLNHPKINSVMQISSTDAQYLTALVENNELLWNPNVARLIGIVVEYRKLSKLFEDLQELSRSAQYDERFGMSRIFSSCFQTNSCTGRLQFIEPSLQTVQKEARIFASNSGFHTISINLRSAFIPCQGFVFFSCDYSQIELRLIAHFTGMIQVFLSTIFICKFYFEY